MTKNAAEQDVLYLRTTKPRKRAWKRAAEKRGISLKDWATLLLDRAASRQNDGRRL